MFLVVHICRLCGIAPVQFEKRLSSSFISLSPILRMMCFVIFSLINAAAITGVVLDILSPLETSVRIRTPVRSFVWLLDFFVVMTTMSIAAYKAPSRMEEVMNCLAMIQKLKIELNGDHQDRKTEIKKIAAVIIVVAIAGFLLWSDYYNVISELSSLRRNLDIMAMYSSYYIAYMVMFVLELQFVFTAIEVHAALKCLNDLLDEMEQLVRKHNSSVILHNNYLVTEVPANMINKLVDSLNTKADEKSGFKYNSPRALPDMIRHLCLTYDQISEVVRRVNECFGPELVVIMASCMLHLIITPYNLIGTFNIAKINATSLAIQSVWCCWHLFCTCAVVEPCYCTHFEMDRTCWLVSRLLLKNTDVLVQVELEKFAKSLLLNKVDYSPMGACTLTRSLVVSMVGSVATYLVIIIQFDIK